MCNCFEVFIKKYKILLLFIRKWGTSSIDVRRCLSPARAFDRVRAANFRSLSSERTTLYRDYSSLEVHDTELRRKWRMHYRVQLNKLRNNVRKFNFPAVKKKVFSLQIYISNVEIELINFASNIIYPSVSFIHLELFRYR